MICVKNPPNPCSGIKSFDNAEQAWRVADTAPVSHGEGTVDPDELGIESIDLTSNRTAFTFSDGSSIDGVASFTYTNGTKGPAADATPVSDTKGCKGEHGDDIANGQG